jgi:hypothetical protein
MNVGMPRVPGVPRVVWILAACLLAAVPVASARERGGDGRFDERRSTHFVLLQDVSFGRRDGGRAARAFERDVLGVLENAYSRMSNQLGLRPPSDVVVRIYDPAFFDREFSPLFGFRAAGFFNGSIHIRGSTGVDAGLAGTLHHEYVHSVIHSAGGAGIYPAWLNEGLAEYMEATALGKRYLTPGEADALARAAFQGGWVPIAQLSGPSLSHFDQGSAGIAYLQSYALVEHLARREGVGQLRRFNERLLKTRNFETALRRVYRLNSGQLEQALIAELGR